MTSYNVIIVGAGIAGLGALNYLYQHGVENVLVLEAKAKPGGRTGTVQLGGHCNTVELGAQWLHDQDNDFCRLVKSSGHFHCKTSGEGNGDFLTPNGEKAKNETVQEIIHLIEGWLREIEQNCSIKDYEKDPEKWKNASVGSFLREKFTAYISQDKTEDNEIDSSTIELKNAVFQWASNFHRIDNACHQLTDLSLFRLSDKTDNSVPPRRVCRRAFIMLQKPTDAPPTSGRRMLRSYADQGYNNFLKGVQAFVDEVLVQPLPESLFSFCSPVSKISWNNGDIENVLIETESGKKYQSQCVIVTSSMGVLKATHKNLFTPELPKQLSSAIEGTGFGPVTKIFLEWDKPWWPRGFDGYQLLWPGHDMNYCDGKRKTIPELEKNWQKAITGFDPILDNKNVILGWLGGEEAQYVETISEDIIKERCVEILKAFTKLDVPTPRGIVVSPWNTDPYFRGAYSFRATEGDALGGDISAFLAEPVTKPNSNEPKIVFAGEAVHKNYFSMLHGAYDSGRNQAAKVLPFISTAIKIHHECSSEPSG